MSNTEANDNIRNEYNQSADAQNALFNQMMRAVPDYRTASPKIIAMLDPLIKTLDINDIGTALTFGDEAEAYRDQIVENILAHQEGDGFAFLRKPMEEALQTFDTLNMEEISGKLARLTAQGGGVLKRNPGIVAATAALAFIASPLALLGGGALIAAKEKVRSMQQSAKPETIQDMEAEIREGIAKFKPMVRNLEAAKLKIPEMRQTIQDLGRGNMQALIRSTLCIAAGQEKLRRIEETDMKQCTDDADTKASVNNYVRTLTQKIAIHVQSRNSSIIDVTNLASTMQSINDNDMALQSILSYEMKQHRSSLAAAATVADNLQLSGIIQEFRQKTEKDTERAIKATEAARKVAASNKVDSPERLQATLNNLSLMKTTLEKAVTSLPKIEKEQKRLQGKVAHAASDLVDAQVKSAAHFGARILGNSSTSDATPQKLEGPR